MIELVDVTVAIGGLRVLEGESRELVTPGLCALMGPSGSGKTTILETLAGLRGVADGRLLVDGKDLGAPKGPGARIRREDLAYCPQSPDLLAGLTLRENVALGARVSGTGKAEATQTAERWAERLEIGHLLDRLPGEVSYGERARAQLARTFAKGARHILIDEPTASLDARQGRRIMSAVLEYGAAQDALVVIATHDDRVAAQCGTSWQIGGTGSDPTSGRAEDGAVVTKPHR